MKRLVLVVVVVRTCGYSRMSVHACTQYAMKKWASTNAPAPGSGGFCGRRPTYSSCSTPSLVLVTVLSARRPSCAVSIFGY